MKVFINFAILWTFSFVVFEAFCLATNLGSVGLHGFAFIVQFLMGCFFVRTRLKL